MSAVRGRSGAAARSITPPSSFSMMRARRAPRTARSSDVGAIVLVVTRARPGGTRRLREDLLERLHLDAVEYALGDVRVARDERPHVGEGVGLDDDQAAAPVQERSRELHA